MRRIKLRFFILLLVKPAPFAGSVINANVGVNYTRSGAICPEL